MYFSRNLNFLVSKWAFLSHFMDAILTYVRRIVIWWLFLNSRSQKKSGVEEKLPRSRHIACILFIHR